MKKLLLSLLFVLPLCGFAQKGMQGVGVNLGLGMSFETSIAANVCLNYQKHLNDRFRLSYSLGVYSAGYKYENPTGYGYYNVYDYAHFGLIAADVHYFFNRPIRLRPYAIGGVLLGVGDISGYVLPAIGGVKLGLGLTYRLGYHWAMNLEAPLYLTVAGSFLPTLGLTYTF